VEEKEKPLHYDLKAEIKDGKLPTNQTLKEKKISDRKHYFRYFEKKQLAIIPLSGVVNLPH
jgi:hypothetical protein